MIDLSVAKQFLLEHAVLGGGALLGSAILYGLAAFGPKLLGGRLRAMFLKLRSAGWLSDPKKPKRIALYLAALEFLEDEVPDPGDPSADAFFLEAGSAISAHLPPVISGSASSWAKVLRALSDEADKDMDAEILEVKAKIAAGPASQQ